MNHLILVGLQLKVACDLYFGLLLTKPLGAGIQNTQASRTKSMNLEMKKEMTLKSNKKELQCEI